MVSVSRTRHFVKEDGLLSLLRRKVRAKEREDGRGIDRITSREMEISKTVKSPSVRNFHDREELTVTRCGERTLALGSSRIRRNYGNTL